MTPVSRLPSTLGATIDAEFGRLGRDPLREIVGCWPEAVGKDIATNAWPARMSRDGTLHVATSSSVWAHELTHCARMILERLTARLGTKTVKRIRFAVGELPERGAERETELEKTVPKVLPEHRRIADLLAGEIADPALRDRVSKAIATSVARHAERPG